MTLTLVTAPATEPVSLTDAKAFLRVDFPDDDAVITTLIAAARDYYERHTGRALISQQWKYTTDSFSRWPDIGDGYGGYHNYRGGGYGLYGMSFGVYAGFTGALKLGRSPLASIQSIQYIDTAGVLQTLASNQYAIDTNDPLGAVVPAYGVYWPFTRYVQNAVTVNFTAGYADAATYAAAQPSGLQAIKMLIAEFYTNRDAAMAGSYTPNPFLRDLVDGHSIIRMA